MWRGWRICVPYDCAGRAEGHDETGGFEFVSLECMFGFTLSLCICVCVYVQVAQRVLMKLGVSNL